MSGYAGGSEGTAKYRTVGTGTTGHAESVRVTFDPSKISYGRLLQIYFSVALDPTELNRQGPDTGTQYRSTIFPANSEQAKIATAYIAQLNAAHAFSKPIVTTVEPGRSFYAAEDYHQNFLALNPTYPYIVINDLPKVENLKRLFPENFRADAGSRRRREAVELTSLAGLDPAIQSRNFSTLDASSGVARHGLQLFACKSNRSARPAG